jgi:hypothetical protein
LGQNNGRAKQGYCHGRKQNCLIHDRASSLMLSL